ncbi:unnamed protein product, partial [Ascophyllum nodosum]
MSPSPGINYNFVVGAYAVGTLILGLLFTLDKVSEGRGHEKLRASVSKEGSLSDGCKRVNRGDTILLPTRFSRAVGKTTEGLKLGQDSIHQLRRSREANFHPSRVVAHTRRGDMWCCSRELVRVPQHVQAKRTGFLPVQEEDVKLHG